MAAQVGGGRAGVQGGSQGLALTVGTKDTKVGDKWRSEE